MDPDLVPLVPQLGMQEAPSFLSGLLGLRLNSVRDRPWILPDPGDLPRHRDSRLTGPDRELVVLADLCCHDRLRELPDHRQLIAALVIKRAEIAGQHYDRLTVIVRGESAVVNVQPVGRLDEGMAQVLVLRVERVVDLEAAAGLGQVSGDADIAEEQAAKPPEPLSPSTPTPRLLKPSTPLPTMVSP